MMIAKLLISFPSGYNYPVHHHPQATAYKQRKVPASFTYPSKAIQMLLLLFSGLCQVTTKRKLKNYTDLFNGEGGGGGASFAQGTILFEAGPDHQHGP